MPLANPTPTAHVRGGMSTLNGDYSYPTPLGNNSGSSSALAKEYYSSSARTNDQQHATLSSARGANPNPHHQLQHGDPHNTSQEQLVNLQQGQGLQGRASGHGSREQMQNIDTSLAAKLGQLNANLSGVQMTPPLHQMS